MAQYSGATVVRPSRSDFWTRNGSDRVSINATFITTDVATWSLPLPLLTHLISIT